MQLVLDSEKTYTYGDWVTGKVLLGHDEANAKSLLIELSGVMSWTAVTKPLTKQSDKIAHSETVYLQREQTKLSGRSSLSAEQTDSVIVNFSIRFPGHNHGDIQTIPGTFANNKRSLLNLRCRHILTATVQGHRNSEIGRQETAELQFKPNESVKLLHAPDITYHEEVFQGLAAAIDITMPAFFVQGGVENMIYLQLRDPDVSLFQITKAFCIVYWNAFGKEKNEETRECLNSITVENSSISSADFTKLELGVTLAECDRPRYQSAHLSCDFVAKTTIRLLNLKTQRHHSLTVSKHITVLPALLRRDGLDGFATKEEQTAILLAKAGDHGAFSPASPELSESETATEKCTPPPYSE